MDTYQLPFFGTVNLSSGEGCFGGEITLEGRNVALDFNVSMETTKATLEVVSQFVYDVVDKVKIARDEMKKSLENDEDVADYLQHHVEELSMEELSEMIDLSKDESSYKQQLCSCFYLKRIGFYPDNEDEFVVLDYTINDELTDYLISVYFDSKGQFSYLSMES